jgi:hypothetical protein
MVYVCKLYANGTPEKTVTFDTLAKAELWACDHACTDPDNGVRHTVSIYGDVKEGTDVINMFPLKIVLT